MRERLAQDASDVPGRCPFRLDYTEQEKAFAAKFGEHRRKHLWTAEKLSAFIRQLHKDKKQPLMTKRRLNDTRAAAIEQKQQKKKADAKTKQQHQAKMRKERKDAAEEHRDAAMKLCSSIEKETGDLERALSAAPVVSATVEGHVKSLMDSVEQLQQDVETHFTDADDTSRRAHVVAVMDAAQPLV